MKKIKITNGNLITLGTTTILLSQLLFLPAAKADWNPGDPSKWFQLPDLQNGMDVLDTFSPGVLPYNKILADDFVCTQTGPITSIHIWGSWLNNNVPMNSSGNPIPPLFDLSFHADVPGVSAGTNTTFSQPGAQLWDMVMQPTQMRIYSTNTERFYDPNQNQVIGTDTLVWQYNFQIPTASAFFQNVSNIYWLNVQVAPPSNPAGNPYVFGWKTSTNHWGDDAVYGDNFSLSQPPPNGWRPMIDPLTGQSLDMAFVLDTVPEPSTLTLMGLGLAVLGRRLFRIRSRA